MTASTIQQHVILGAGQVGLAVMDELTAAGVAVTLVNRSGQVSETLPSSANLVRGDVTNADSVASLCAKAKVVFLTSQPPYTEWPAQWPPMMQAIIDGVARTDARLVFADNLYCYGSTQGAPLHEDLPYAASGRKGRTRAQIATTLLAAHQAGKVRATSGRASDFYGPRVTSSALGEHFFGAALAGKTANLAGDLTLPHTYTYIRDFARGLVTLSEHAETLTTEQFIKRVEAEIGQPIKVRTAGHFLLSLVGLFNPAAGEIVEMLYEFEQPFVVDHSKFAAAFGANPTPHGEAIRETVAWYRT